MKNENLFRYRPDTNAYKKYMREKSKIIFQDLYNAGCGLPHFTDVSGGRTGWTKFYMHLTFFCPFNCPFCCTNSGCEKSEEMTAETCFDIIRQVISAGFKHIIVTGGEPLCYSEWDMLLTKLSGLDHCKTELVLRTTLGFDLSREKIGRICNVFDRVVISIDGSEKMHDRNRGPGVYRQAVDNIRKCLDDGRCDVAVNAVMTRQEFEGEEGAALHNLCESLGIDDYAVHGARPMGKLAGQLDLETEFTWRKKNVGKVIIPSLLNNCGIGEYLYMEPDGSLFPCYAWCDEKSLLGNLNKECLDNILNNPTLLQLRSYGVDTNMKCKSCDVRYLCGGLCKSRVINDEDFNNGDFDCANKRKSIIAMLNKYGIETKER